MRAAVPAPSALLVDRGFSDTGEEVKIYTRGDRVIALGKKVVPEAWDAVGEGGGFFRCGAEAAPELLRGLAKVKCVVRLFVLAHNLLRMAALVPQLIGWSTGASAAAATAA